MTRLVVMVSGNGSNLQAILEACESGRLAARVVAVVSNRADAYALERARKAGVEALCLVRPQGEERGAYDERLADLVASQRPDWIVLAGWMHILSARFLSRFQGRVINLHPALPGAFPGTNAITRALEAGVERTGVMVHLVDEGVDSGPVLAVEEVAVEAGDTPDSLAERIHQVEHRLLTATLIRLVEGQCEL